MGLPKGCVLLKDATIQFVNFDNILNQAKKARDGHLTGYIEIEYPESFEYLFFKNGDTISAAQRIKDSYSEYPIEEVIKKAKKARQGIVNIHQIDEELLNMILALLKEKPLFNNKRVEDINIDVLFEKLKELDFCGFLALSKEDNYTFVKFQSGKPTIIYPTNKDRKKIDLSTLITLLKKENGMFISGFKGEKLEKQANPALIELYLKFFNSLIDSFKEIVGPSIVRKTLLPAHENASQSSNILTHFTINDDLGISYEPFIATDEEITKGFALWIDQFSDAIFVVLGRKTDEIIHSSIKDYRFALKSAGFFNSSKLSRLDI